MKGSIWRDHVPLLVATNNEAMKKISIPIKLINHPSLADEIGYNQKGLLRIWCEKFENMLDCISRRLENFFIDFSRVNLTAENI